MFAGLIIALVIGAIGFQRALEPGNHDVDIGLGRIEIDDQRTDFGAQEMVRAGCAQSSQRAQFLRVRKFQHRILIVEMTKLALFLADKSANFRHQPRGNGAALGSRQALYDGTTESGLAYRLLVQPFNGLVDDGERRFVAGFRIVGPGEKPMTFKDNAFALGFDFTKASRSRPS